MCLSMAARFWSGEPLLENDRAAHGRGRNVQSIGSIAKETVS